MYRIEPLVNRRGQTDWDIYFDEEYVDTHLSKEIALDFAFMMNQARKERLDTPIMRFLMKELDKEVIVWAIRYAMKYHYLSYDNPGIVWRDLPDFRTDSREQAVKMAHMLLCGHQYIAVEIVKYKVVQNWSDNEKSYEIKQYVLEN